MMLLAKETHACVGPVSYPWLNGNAPLIASEVKCVLLNVLYTLVMELVSSDITSSVLKLISYCSIVPL